MCPEAVTLHVPQYQNHTFPMKKMLLAACTLLCLGAQAQFGPGFPGGIPIPVAIGITITPTNGNPLYAGGTKTYTVTATGGSTAIVLSTSGSTPASVTTSFSPSSVTPGSSSTLTLSAGPNATPGTYSFNVTGMGQNGSIGTASSSVAIASTATIAYTGTPYCGSSGTATVTRTGSAGGTYTASPDGLSLDAATGSIDLAASQAGTYTVTYSVGGAAASASVAVRPASFFSGYMGNPIHCGGQATAEYPFSGPTGITYTWTNSNPAIGLAASGSGNLPSYVPQLSGITPVKAYVRVTPSGGTGCTPAAAVICIRVNPTPVITSIPDQTLCAGSTSAPITFQTDNLGTCLTRWIDEANFTNLNATIGLGPYNYSYELPAFTAINNSSAPVTHLITVIPQKDGCLGNLDTFYITVKPSVASLSYAAGAHCPSGSLSPATSGSTGGSWSVSPATAAFNSSNGTFALASAAPNTYTVTYALSATDACVPAASATVEVLPQSTVNTVGNAVYCNAANAPATPFTGTASSYSWTNSNPSIGLPASGTGDLPAFLTSNGGSTTQIATITVTPVGNGSSSCPGRSTSFAVRVYPTPDVTAVADQLYCRGNATAALPFSGSVAGTAFAWSSSSTATGLLTGSGTAQVPSFTARNNNAAAGGAGMAATSSVTVTPSFNKCPGTPVTFQYIVNDCGTLSAPAHNDPAQARLALDAALVAGPSPAQSTLQVRYSGNAPSLQLQVLDASGQPLLGRHTLSGTTASIDVSTLPPGQYTLQVSDPRSGILVVKRFVKL